LKFSSYTALINIRKDELVILKVIGEIKKIRRNGLNQVQLGWLFLFPALILIFSIALYPALNTIYLSFFKYKAQLLIYGKTYIGIENYIKLLHDGRFWGAFVNTVVFTIAAVSIETVLGLGSALVMNMTFKGRGLLRTSVLIPWAIPTVVSGMMWRFMYNDQLGVVNDILYRLGLIDNFVSWLGKTNTALICVIIADVWKTTPYMALLLLSGLQTIPHELYEAGAIDGASKWQVFLKITLPLLKPVLMVALLFRSLATFKIYDLIAVLTNGGPANSTESLSMYTVKTYFKFGNYGYGATMAVATLFFAMLLSLLFLNTLKTKVKV